jgi:class 3 adenylate cyclase
MVLAGKEDEVELEKTKARVLQTLNRGLQFETSTELSEKFLRRHVNSKVKLAVLYADIAGSTRMSITHPTNVLASIVQVFSQEMSLVVAGYGGYVLKYVGDAIIAFFPGEFNARKACDNAARCARAMMRVVSECLDPAFEEKNFPSIGIKVGIDFGSNLVILYGKDEERSYIDMVGSSISMAAKITGVAGPGQIIIGRDVYANLDAGLQKEFAEFEISPQVWTFRDARTGDIYKLYATI